MFGSASLSSSCWFLQSSPSAVTGDLLCDHAVVPRVVRLQNVPKLKNSKRTFKGANVSEDASLLIVPSAPLQELCDSVPCVKSS